MAPGPAVTAGLAALARREPDRGAVAAPAGRLSRAELWAAVRRVAAGLHDHGLRPGDRVGITLEPDLPLVLAILGAWEAGCVAIPINHRLTAIERDRALTRFGPALILDAADEVGELSATDATNATDGRDASGHEPPERARGRESGSVEHDPAPHRAAAILLTSGSTGEPRGVELSHGNLEAVNRASAERLRSGDGDRWLLSLSPGHVGGLALLHRAILGGAVLEVVPRFDPGEVVGMALEGRVTHASLVPAMLLGLVEALEAEPSDRIRLEVASHFRCLLIGGASCPPVLVDRALALGLPLALTYGLTQASSQVATATPAEVRGGGAGCGRPLEGVEVRIDGVGGEGEPGEILVRGPTVALRYVGSEEPMCDSGGWLHTGDLGRLDDQGRLHVAGRTDSRIISGGANVQPEEVEAFLRSLPGIREAVVLGVPDERWGERVCALVVTEHADPDRDAVREAIDVAARDRLAPAKRPRTVRLVEALPLTPTGKIDREAARVLVSAFPNEPGRPEADPGPNP